MNKCLNCGKEIKSKKFCSTTCQNKFQNSVRADKKYGQIREFVVKCSTCGKNIVVKEREKLFPKKEKYYCNRSCANTRVHSKETKEKIRESVVKNINKNPPVIKRCKNCSEEFEISFRKRRQKFCSKRCVTIWRNKNENLAKKGGQKSVFIKITSKSNKKTFIYALEYPNGNIRYVGKSDNPKKRLNAHLKKAKENKTYKDKWINSLPGHPFLNIIEEITYGEWQNREIYWINLYKNKGFVLVNGTDGGEGSNGFSGKKHSDETKKKLSDIVKKRNFSKESKLKISGESNGRCKLKDKEVMDILFLFYESETKSEEIAKKYNTTKKYIYLLTSGRRRKQCYDKYMKIKSS